MRRWDRVGEKERRWKKKWREREIEAVGIRDQEKEEEARSTPKQ